uniref:Secreted protein n=1 Tax=Heterorhabditis bacteriophora TaxID=37862 RepID=A0A1I7X2V6_HETBA
MHRMRNSQLTCVTELFSSLPSVVTLLPKFCSIVLVISVDDDAVIASTSSCDGIFSIDLSTVNAVLFDTASSES